MKNTNKKPMTMLCFTLMLMSIASCASNGSQKRANEIGDPSVPSPEMKQHYQTVYDAFSRHDTNADGFLDEHEFAQLQTDPNIVTMRSKIAELANSGPLLFAEIDENGDGRITINELEVIVQPLIPHSRK